MLCILPEEYVPEDTFFFVHIIIKGESFSWIQYIDCYKFFSSYAHSTLNNPSLLWDTKDLCRLPTFCDNH